MGERTNKILSFLFPILLIIIIGAIAWSNYTPGTWLSGWDVLHPEFDFPLAFNRAIYGVWRSDQGLGTVAVHSHMADLPRIVFLWLASFALPTNVLRYFYFFVTLVLGPLGVYFFAKNTLPEKKGKVSGVLAASFLAGLYYLFNFAVLQLYYVPFEMFAAQFFGLPWLFYLSYRFVTEGKRKLLLWLFIVSILASPMAFAATLFYAFYISIVVFLLTYSLLHRKGKKAYFRNSILALSIILLANVYWLLPNIYSVFTQSESVSKATINRVFSPEAFLSNKAYGDIESVLTFKNHLFSWREYDTPNSTFVDLLDEWNTHIASGDIEFLLRGIVLMVLVGIVLAILRKDKVGIALLPVTAIALFFLINENPPFEALYSYLRTHMGIFREGFRMPFTKFSLVLVFSFSYYFSYLLNILISKCLDIKQSLLKYSLFALIILLPLTMFFEIYKPYFNGNLISSSMRVNIPGAYFELFRYMEDKDGRIAKLPMHTPYGWTYYSWDYEGAGFIPFGLENPTLDRDFDRWSPYNESFYNEASFALYSGNLDDFERALEKYDVKYILLDESVINAGGEDDVLMIDETKEMLKKSTQITEEESIGFLTLYKTTFEEDGQYLLPDAFSDVNTDLVYSQTDPVYETYGTYVDSGIGIVYPFLNIDKRAGLEVWMEDDGVHLSKQLDLGKVKKIVLPAFGGGNLPIAVYAKMDDSGDLVFRFTPQTPKILINDNEIGSQEYSQVHRFSVGNNKPKYLVLNDESFALDNLSGSEKYVGTLDNALDGEVDISIYANDIKYSNLEEDLLQVQARLCADPSKKYDVVGTSGEITLDVGNEPICFGRGFEVEEDSVWVFSFEARSESGVFPNVCITEGETQKCLDAFLPNGYLGEEGEWKKFEVALPLKTGEHWLDFVAVNTAEEGAGTVVYKNVDVRGVDLYEHTKYPLQWNFPTDSLKENVVENVTINKIELVFPISNQIYENFYLERGRKKASNCDAKKTGSVYKTNTGTEVIYRAEDGGASCDNYDYPQIKDNQSYVLGIEGENVLGRSLRIYLYDGNYDKAYVEDLMASGEYEDYFITTPKDLNGKGYTLNFETRAFADLTSENVVEKITFTPIPDEWLANIRIEMQESELEKKNSLQIKEVRKLHPWAYEVLGVEGSGIFVLSQAYDPGWVAYKGNFSLLKTLLLPFSEKLDHVKVNSWANGWEVENSDCEGDGCTLTLIYIPQHLQTFGFILLALVLVPLSVGVFYEAKKKS